MSPPWSLGFPWNHCCFTDPTIAAMSAQRGVYEKAAFLFLDNCKSMRKHKSQELVLCNSGASVCLEINCAFEALLRTFLRKPGTRKYFSALFIHSALVKKCSPWILHSLLRIEWTEVRTVAGRVALKANMLSSILQNGSGSKGCRAMI